MEQTSAILVGPRLLLYGIPIAIFATAMPSFLLSEALHRISAQANGTIGTLSPLVTIILAALILGGRMTPVGMTGTALALRGVGWFTLTKTSYSRQYYRRLPKWLRNLALRRDTGK